MANSTGREILQSSNLDRPAELTVWCVGSTKAVEPLPFATLRAALREARRVLTMPGWQSGISLSACGAAPRARRNIGLALDRQAGLTDRATGRLGCGRMGMSADEFDEGFLSEMFRVLDGTDMSDKEVAYIKRIVIAGEQIPSIKNEDQYKHYKQIHQRLTAEMPYDKAKFEAWHRSPKGIFCSAYGAKIIAWEEGLEI